jgi:cytochrome P450
VAAVPEKLPFEFLFTPEFSRDPYAVYASLREQGPIFPIDFPPGFDAYLIIDHEHGRAALNDPRLSKDMQRFGDYFKAIATEDDILFDSRRSPTS